MSVRNYGELGPNVSEIAFRLMGRDELVKLLYYNTPDALSQPVLSSQDKTQKIFNQLIKIVPKFDPDLSGNSQVAIRIDEGEINSENPEFNNIQLTFEIYTPANYWLLNEQKLRPFSIMGEIKQALQSTTLNGLGKIHGGNFKFILNTEEGSIYEQYFLITAYD